MYGCTSSPVCGGEYSGEKEVTHIAAPYIKADPDSKQGDSCSNLPFQNRQAVRNRKKDLFRKGSSTF